ncbi:MAG: hypothetical protein HQ495_04935 [Alphaproteobacteria bacterium]|nr:hypothetical protein [Alphaproteobacteria bacterium]
MANSTTPSQRRHPNMIGAGLLAGLLAGLALGGALDNFGLWVPVLGALGFIAGILLHSSRRDDAL